LPQIPNLEGGVVAARKQVPAIGMELNFIHITLVSVVVLD
jgi:hypothetical protein